MTIQVSIMKYILLLISFVAVVAKAPEGGDDTYSVECIHNRISNIIYECPDWEKLKEQEQAGIIVKASHI